MQTCAGDMRRQPVRLYGGEDDQPYRTGQIRRTRRRYRSLTARCCCGSCASAPSQAPGTSTMSIMLADVLAIIAVVLSAGSLGAQVGSYLFSGPVVRVTGFTYSGFGKPTQPGGPMERVTKGTLLTATNKGRAPVTVNSVGISFSSRFPPSLLILEDPRAA